MELELELEWELERELGAGWGTSNGSWSLTPTDLEKYGLTPPNADFGPKWPFPKLKCSPGCLWDDFWSHFQNPENVYFAPGSPPYNSNSYTGILTKI